MCIYGARAPCGPISRSSARILNRVATSQFSGVVALDGPSGTGKSTVARRLATRLVARYLDTGAMSRAAIVAALRKGHDLTDGVAITTVIESSLIEIYTDP